MHPNSLLFVGSVPLPSSGEVFEALGRVVGARAIYLPDGETGIRKDWIRWQDAVFKSNPSFVLIDAGRKLPGYKDALARPFYDTKPGVDAGSVQFGPLGYAREAIRSYADFVRLRNDGVIPPGTRFQVSIPTALDILTGFVVTETRARVETALEKALEGEVSEMVAKIAPADLAIQWDAAMEVTGYDGGHDLHVADILPDSVERIVRQASFVPAEAHVGIHLCYGDPGHKHVIEPSSLETCVKFANKISADAKRPIEWVHMPVPRDRSDDEYFAPLRGLEMKPETRLFLGLIHLTDGLDGTSRRLAAAKKFVDDFGIATECGFGRRDPATIPALLDLHVAASELL